jgi:Fic family protein
MLDEIDRLKQELDALRPLRGESIRSLMEALDVEMVYSSNAIEGNSLTLRETQLVLEQGITVGGKPLSDHLDAVRLSNAWAKTKSLADLHAPVTEAELLDLHSLVMGADDPQSGRYRNMPVFIKGAKHVPPNAAKVPEMMSRLFSDTGYSLHPVTSSARWHYQIAAIHPFADGNGRTARLIMNLMLLRAGFPPLRIQPADRLAYYEALDRSNIADSSSFERWIEERELGELKHWLSHLNP